MADKRHQKAIAKGIGCQVAYNYQNDNRRAQKLVPAKDLAKEERVVLNSKNLHIYNWYQIICAWHGC